MARRSRLLCHNAAAPATAFAQEIRMTTFPCHTVESAPDAARPMLEQAQRQLGFVPNLYAHLAESPAALGAYFDLSARFEQTGFTPIERQVVLLAVSAEHGCEFCVAAHSMVARHMADAPADLVDALRSGTPLPDARLDTLARFVRRVVRDRGWVDDASVQAFLDAGFETRHVLEVVLGVAMKTLGNYANHLTGTQTNAQIAAFAWQRGSADGAAELRA
jgi:AhpD family alkylhydroperoxidase